MNQVENLERLDKEIARVLEKLESLKPGTDEYGNVMQDLNNQIDRREKMIANIHAARELELKERKLDYDEVKDTDDTLHKTREEENRNKDRIFSYLFEGAKFTAQLVFFGLTLRTGFRFEETGTLTSPVFREGRNIIAKWFK